MKTISQTILGFLLLLLFTGCDATYRHLFLVENGLDEPITVEFITHELPRDSLQTHTISAHRIDTLTRKSGVRDSKENAPDTYAAFGEMTYFSLLRITRENGDTVVSLLRDRKEWTYEVVEKELGVYYLFIDSSDF